MGTEKLLVLGAQDTWDMEALEAEFDVVQVLHDADPAELDAGLRDGIKLAMLKGHRAVGAALFDLFPNLQIMANYGVGYDAIDVAAAQARGIAVTNTPDVLSADVADQAVVMLLSFLRQTAAAEQWLRDGKWAGTGEFPLQRRMSGGHVGILGLGRIGRAIAERLQAFDCPIHYYSRAPKDVPADWTYHDSTVGLAGAVDFLVIALSGGPETAGLVDRETILALGPTGVLVNISRGSTVDEASLLAALETRAIGGAALDVFQGEPNLDARFLTLDNVLLQPHVASATVETRKAMGALVRENLIAARDGAPLVTPV